jgi:hypothetical protein
MPSNPSRPFQSICEFCGNYPTIKGAKIGLAYYQSGQVDQACQYFNEALMLDACEPTALQYLAEIRAIQS